MISVESFDTRWVEDANGCHIWQRSKTNRGYGTLTTGGVGWLAHRAAWALKRGPIPEGMKVLHECDNPSCVNPKHLFLGTSKDNMDDMMAKGRGGYRRIQEPGTSPRDQGGKAYAFLLLPEAKRRLDIACDYTRRTKSFMLNQLILTHLPEKIEDDGNETR